MILNLLGAVLSALLLIGTIAFLALIALTS